MGNHIFQRAFLLTIVAVLGTYTVLEYFYTRNILSQCLEVTTYGTTIATSSSVASSPTSIPEMPLAEQHSEQLTLQNAEDAREKKPAKVEKSPAISKVTMMYGPHAKDETMKLIIEGHKKHAERHGHGIRVLDRQLLHGLWSKHAWMLQIMLEEMQKPEDLRTKWLSWFDTDIIIMNPNVPLDVFLPPKDFSHINLLCTNDHNGLNNGAFMIRVGEWGVRYFVDSLALHTYQPDLKLKYSEQSAMEVTLGIPKYADKTMHVPQRWFNAYKGPRNPDGRLIRGQKVPDNTIMPGDLQLHFAGKKTTKALMPQWVALASNETSGWHIPLGKTKLETEIALFWKLEKEKKEWDEPVKKPGKAETESKQPKKLVQAVEQASGDVEQSAVEHGTDDMEQGAEEAEQQDSES